MASKVVSRMLPRRRGDTMVAPFPGCWLGLGSRVTALVGRTRRELGYVALGLLQKNSSSAAAHKEIISNNGPYYM